VVFLPEDTTGGITWNLITIGDFSLRVPADDEGEWAVSTATGSRGERIFVGHRSGSRFDALVLVQIGTGDASIQVLVEGAVWQVQAEEVRSLVSGPIADVIFHVLESINVGP
jgi:hypothetical protein